jgi:putative ABC transport system substrate-binding protein
MAATPKFAHENASQAMHAEKMFDVRMRRRDVIVGVGVAAAWPLTAGAQAKPVLGFLASGARSSIEASMIGVFAGLKEGGFVDGHNLTIEYRWAEGHFERLPPMAVELVQRPVDVLFAAQGNVSALAAKRATSTIPIVFVTADDPVATGLVASLNRPGGNLTGVSRLGTALVAKNVELLHQLLPSVMNIGLLVNPKRQTAQAQIKNAQDATAALGKTIRVLHGGDEREIDAAFEKIASEHIRGVVVPFDPLFNIHRRQIVALAAQHAVPTAYSLRESVSAGGLMSYGDSATDSYKLGGDLAARILKGAKPAELPVQLTTKLELVINLKTAKALGLAVPINLLGRADEVIE